MTDHDKALAASFREGGSDTPTKPGICLLALSCKEYTSICTCTMAVNVDQSDHSTQAQGG